MIASWQQYWGAIVCVLVFLVIVPPVSALKLSVAARPANSPQPRCIRNFVQKGNLVVVKVKTSGSKGDGQVLNMSIVDNLGNEYGRNKDVAGETSSVFTALEDSAFDVCFENVQQTLSAHGTEREIDLDIDIGADARDWNVVGQTEKLKPMELELRRIEENVDEIVAQMDYLRAREEKLRDTNESTNARVKFFSIGTLIALAGLSVWQITYLRQFFRSKHLI
ncbi:emp24/gp25L/p24 family/GOLD-domain-containing protein [Lipomyces oligophaga]|uniref:emp24/gp25L/p24 family/GOLD-domain-containing protein n=1 Tax=Lipomyces oligophaga TaxID=45792 RepID=UPI0034CEB023